MENSLTTNDIIILSTFIAIVIGGIFLMALAISYVAKKAGSKVDL